MKAILFLLFSTLLFSSTYDKIDDWDENATKPSYIEKNFNCSGMIKSVQSMAMPAPMMAKRRLGFSVGGAKDSDNFYENIKKGYLPKISSITYEGVFYDHYFKLPRQECKELFCPSYETAVRKNPFSEEKEYYVAVGLDSNLDANSFKRRKLNLVVVLDISGSMGSRFDRYYYDGGVKKEAEGKKTKMQIANQSIVNMMAHLKDEDSFGVVLFDNDAYLAKPLREIKYTDMNAIKSHVLELRPRGGTNWSSGYKKGLDLFKEIDKSAENRIIFITDAMPNRGELRKDRLFGMVKEASKRGIYTTFIGVGVDFNSDLVEYISKTRGANYYSVHSNKEFKKRLDDEFDYMVTPLVFDLKLKLSSNNFEIEKVFGAPKAKEHTGEILEVDTLFPSSSKDKKVKGGVILVKLKKIGSGKNLELKVSYKDRDGKNYSNSKKVSFKDGEYFAGSGVRKAVILSDFVSLMKNFLVDARKSCNDRVNFPFKPYPMLKKRCLIPPVLPDHISSTWERKSCKLEVSDGYKKLFYIFFKRFDMSLKKESEILKTLIGNKKTILDDWNFIK